MSINNVVAFQGWNSSNRAWNTSTWNGDVAYTVTATGQIGSAAGITNVGVAVTGLVLDLFTDMLMRDPVRVGTAITLPQIEAGDFFYLHNTSVGAGAVSSYEDADGTSVVGVGTTHLDNIYRCQAVEY